MLGLLYTNIDQTLVNSLHLLMNCEIGGLDCCVITTEYRTRVHCIHILTLFCKALVHVIYLGVSGLCSHTILRYTFYIQRILFTEQQKCTKFQV